jgi:hypothetical protein
MSFGRRHACATGEIAQHHGSVGISQHLKQLPPDFDRPDTSDKWIAKGKAKEVTIE